MGESSNMFIRNSSQTMRFLMANHFLCACNLKWNRSCTLSYVLVDFICVVTCLTQFDNNLVVLYFVMGGSCTHVLWDIQDGCSTIGTLCDLLLWPSTLLCVCVCVHDLAFAPLEM